MKLTQDDIPCLVKAKYIRLPKKRINDLATADDVAELFDNEVDCYEEILIGGGNASSKIEFSIARYTTCKDLEYTSMPDGDFYFSKIKKSDGSTYFYLVKIYKVITRIPRAPNCIKSIMNYSVNELEIDMKRLGMENSCNSSHYKYVSMIMNWYVEIGWNRYEWYRNEDTSYDDDGDDISIYPYHNLLDEIAGYD